MSKWVRDRPEGGFVYGDSRGVQGRAATREEAEHRAEQLAGEFEGYRWCPTCSRETRAMGICPKCGNVLEQQGQDDGDDALGYD